MAAVAESGLGLRMHAERTPNPNSLKWVIAPPIVAPGTTANFDERPESGVSPLAARLFGIDGVVGVFIASEFVTVSKSDAVEWLEIAQPIVDALKECIESGISALGAGYVQPEPMTSVNRADLVERIRHVIDEQIRPSVARDGGDVVFRAYRDGVVELEMRGACSGCPSATATLEHAIERRLCDEIPEVSSVVAV